MEQSGVVGLSFEGHPERVADFRDAPFCSQQAQAEMMGLDQTTEDVVRGWFETNTVPTVKIGRRRVSTSTASIATVAPLQLSCKSTVAYQGGSKWLKSTQLTIQAQIPTVRVYPRASMG